MEGREKESSDIMLINFFQSGKIKKYFIDNVDQVSNIGLSIVFKKNQRRITKLSEGKNKMLKITFKESPKRENK